MEQLNKQVRKAQRLLGLQRFVGVLGWCCSVTLVIALALIIADKFWPSQAKPWDAWVGVVVLAAAVAAGMVAAALWAMIRDRGSLDAAIEVDRRFGLKERVSSALALSGEERASGAGKALLDDAVRRVRRIDVGEHFALAPGRQLLLPLAPAIIALVVVLFVHPTVDGKQAQASLNPAIKKQIENSSDGLVRKLKEQRKQAEQLKLKDAQDLFKRLEEGTEDLADQTKGDRKEALKKLNDLAREINQRRQELGGAERIQEKLDQLKNIDRGPADKFLQAVKQGDFQQAKEELQKLKDKIADGKLTDEERQQLANQLDQMQQKLQNLADAHRQAQEDLQKRIQQARQQGRNDEASKLQEQLDQLRQQTQQMNQLQDLANRLGQCAQCLQNGRLQDAGELLDQLEADMASLQEQLQEMEMLNQALDQLAQCRCQMNCANCGGIGCPLCQGKIPGEGLGAGRGKGDRPEEENPVSFIDVKPPMKIGPGTASVVGEVEGPNYKGDIQQELQEQYETARRQPVDPLTGQPMSRKQRDYAREYFNRLREGD